MSQRDFQRTLSDSSAHLSRPTGWWSYTHLDAWLLMLLLALCGYGLFVLYSASGQDWGYVQRQTIRMGAGFLVMIVLAQLRPRTFQRLGPWAYAAGCALLVGVLLFGVGAKGAQRWIEFGGFRFQPSEILKLVLPLMVGGYLARKALPPTLPRLLIALGHNGRKIGLLPLNCRTLLRLLCRATFLNLR